MSEIKIKKGPTKSRNIPDDIKNKMESELKFNAKKYDKRTLCFFYIGLYTGLRVSEILSLKVEQLFDKIEEKYELKSHVEMNKKQMKGKKYDRTIKLVKRLEKPLLDWIEEQKLEMENYIFVGQKNKDKPIHRITMYCIIKPIFRNLGVEKGFSLHSFRKTFAKKIYESCGKDILKTANAIGHKDPKSTMCYLNVYQDEVDEILNKAFE